MASQLWEKEMAALSDTMSLDGVAKLLSVQTLDDYDTWYIENNHCSCNFDEVNECWCGFEDGRERATDNYLLAVESVATELFKEHGLTLEKKSATMEYKITPIKSWDDAANNIRETINGVGYFEFKSLSDFLDSGPYDGRSATLSHLHYIPEWYRVYEGSTAKSVVERRMR